MTSSSRVGLAPMNLTWKARLRLPPPSKKAGPICYMYPPEWRLCSAPESDLDFKVPKGFKYNWIVYGGTEIKKKAKIPISCRERHQDTRASEFPDRERKG